MRRAIPAYLNVPMGWLDGNAGANCDISTPEFHALDSRILLHVQFLLKF